jgi:hypothetical protein
MTKLGFAVAAVVLGFSSAALAQTLTAEEQAACKAVLKNTARAPYPAAAVSSPA